MIYSNCNISLLGYQIVIFSNCNISLLGYQIEIFSNCNISLIGYQTVIYSNCNISLLGYQIVISRALTYRLLNFLKSLTTTVQNVWFLCDSSFTPSKTRLKNKFPHGISSRGEEYPPPTPGARGNFHARLKINVSKFNQIRRPRIYCRFFCKY